MSESIERPAELRIDAWTAAGAPNQPLPPWTPWAQQEKVARSTRFLAPPPRVDDRRWQHPEVGWGLVLPDKPGATPAEMADAEDAPPPIIRLLKSRPGSPVFRYRPELQTGYLRRYYRDRPAQDLSVQAPNPGIGEGRIPRYLLIYAAPTVIPWSFQYALNMSTCVGRLDLSGQPLDNYVTALISDWKDQSCDPRAPVVWSVDHGQPDITWLMARAVGLKLWGALANDADLTGRLHIENEAATAARLGAALAERSPALVVTTSHGMTGPVDNPTLMKAQLGAPVDSKHQPITLADLAGWNPSGAIWFAQACCAAGSDSESRYKGLLPADGAIGSLLETISQKAGAMVAPLASALLGAERPLRAFVGHVEPTFDWTLRDPINKQVVAHTLVQSLYPEMYRQGVPTPIGYALREFYNEAGAFRAIWQSRIEDINRNVPKMRDWALYTQLVALDRQTLVILGDPTVALPPLVPTAP